MIYTVNQAAPLDTTIEIDLSTKREIIFYIDGYGIVSTYVYYNFYVGNLTILSYNSSDIYTNQYYSTYTIVNNNICRLYATGSNPPYTAYYYGVKTINTNQLRITVSDGTFNSYYTIKIYVA